MRAVNLIPAEQRKGAGGAAGRSEGAAFVIVGLLAGVVVLALMYGLSHKQVSDRRAEAAKLTAQAGVARAQAAALAPYTSFLTLRDQRVTSVQQLADSRFDWAHAFHELGRVLPFDVSLSTVTGSMSGASSTTPGQPPQTPAAPAPGAAPSSQVTSSSPPGSTPSLAISGCTVSQSEVAFTLTRLRLMDGVSGVTLQSSTEASSGPGASTTGTSGTTCPVTFSVTVAYNPLPAVASPTAPANATAAATGPATTATPPAGTTAPAAAATPTPVASATGGK